MLFRIMGAEKPNYLANKLEKLHSRATRFVSKNRNRNASATNIKTQLEGEKNTFNAKKTTTKKQQTRNKQTNKQTAMCLKLIILNNPKRINKTHY